MTAAWLRVLAAVTVSLAAAGARAEGVAVMRLACSGDSVSAEVTVNGVYKGPCPLDTEVQAGPVSVRAVKAVNDNQERVFSSEFKLGDGVVKRLDIILGKPQFNDEGLRAVAERKRLLEARAQRNADLAARREELLQLVKRQNEERSLRLSERVAQAFSDAGLVAGDGKPFRDCDDGCPELVWVPAGRTPSKAALRSDLDRWMAETVVVRPVAVGRFEVSFDEWDACVADRMCSKAPQDGVTEGLVFDSRWGRGKQPVVNVTHKEAQGFLNWVTDKSGRLYRLLSLVEFRHAARGGATTAFPWGEQAEAGAAVCKNCGGEPDRPAPVGSRRPNGFGLHDMVGNVAEHVADCLGAGSPAEDAARLFARVDFSQQPRDGGAIDACRGVKSPLYAIAGGDWETAATPWGTFIGAMLDTARVRNVGMRVARPFREEVSHTVRFVRDCAGCPAVAGLPAGTFEMGSRYRVNADEREASQWPLHEVTLGRFSIGASEVTRGQFAAFVRETGYGVPPGCDRIGPGFPEVMTPAPKLSWQETGFASPQTDGHPVVCVNREDALAYLAWLSRKTGRHYRLPTEAEWEYAARGVQRIGELPAGPWSEPSKACVYANLAGEAVKEMVARYNVATFKPAPCWGGLLQTAHAESYERNGWGLYGMFGNAAEWVEDCWNPSYAGASPGGQAARGGDCSRRPVRGGSWADGLMEVSVAGRVALDANTRTTRVGFRVVRDESAQ